MYILFLIGIAGVGFFHPKPWWLWLAGLIVITAVLAIVNPHTFAKMRAQREHFGMSRGQYAKDYASMSWLTLIPAAVVTCVLYGAGWAIAAIVGAAR